MRCSRLVLLAALSGVLVTIGRQSPLARADAPPASSGTAESDAMRADAVSGGAVTSGRARDAGDPDALRIASAGHSLKWNWTPPGHAERYGHAETLIHAPLASVRTRVQDYAHYREI